MSRPKNETDVSTKAFPLVLDVLRENNIDPEELMEGLPLTTDILADQRERVHWDHFAEFLQRFEDRMGGPAIFQTYVPRFLERPEFKIYFQTFALAVNPYRALELMCLWFGPHVFPMVKAELIRVDVHRARMVQRIPEPYRDCPQYFRLTQQGVTALLQFVGGRRGRVTMSLHPREAVYEIDLPPSMTLWSRVRRKLGDFRIDKGALASLAEQQEEVQSMVEALRESEERYRHLVDQSPSLIWRLDPVAGRLTFTSSVIKDLMGYDAEEIQRLSVDDLVVPEDRPVMHQRIQELIAGQAPGDRLVQELHQIRKDGQVIVCEVHAAAIRNERGEVVSIQGITHDITARKQVEQERERALLAESERDQLAREIQERRRVEAELKKARDRAEEANRLKNSILATMSHEVRTPLTGLLGFTELLLRDFRDTDHESKLQVIRRSGRRLLSLLNNMLDLARMEADKLPIEKDHYPIHITVRHVVELLSLEAEQKNLSLEVDVPKDLVVHSDPRRDEQILLNIIGNAIRYTEEGSIRVEALGSKGEGDTGDFVELRVTDTGVGIDPDFMPQVFDEFRQESEGPKRQFGGSGLGLAITRRLLESMGGSISIDSRKALGTTVTVRLPGNQVSATDETGEDTQPDILAAPSEEGDGRPTVLVVEDDPDCLDLVETFLSPSFEVVSARGSKEALELTSTHHVDCALLDINLEGSRLDGYGLLEKLRSLPGGAALPIASMSAYAMEEMAERGRGSFDQHFRKPLPLEDLRRWVDESCSVSTPSPH